MFYNCWDLKMQYPSPLKKKAYILGREKITYWSWTNRRLPTISRKRKKQGGRCVWLITFERRHPPHLSSSPSIPFTSITSYKYLCRESSSPSKLVVLLSLSPPLQKAERERDSVVEEVLRRRPPYQIIQ